MGDKLERYIELLENDKNWEFDENIDEEAVLQRMQELASKDWRGHLPYNAILEYFTNDKVRERYTTHVNSCTYCKELIAVFSRANV